MCEPGPSRLRLGVTEQVAENATTQELSSELKPVENEHSTSELKLRPPREKVKGKAFCASLKR
jgi:hypothetical protein